MKKTKNYNCIKAVLATKGKTQLWLSNQLKVHKTTVSSWCTNSKQPKIDTLYEIANLLEVEIGDLFTKMKDIREIDLAD